MEKPDKKIFINKLLDYIIDADRQSSNNIIDEWAKAYSYQDAMINILEPALIELGKNWQLNELIMAQGYVASKIAEDVLLKVQNTSKLYPTSCNYNRKAIIGNIEDDFHGLGRKMVISFLKLAGWEIYDLGNDVLAKDFVDKAVEIKAHIIGASAMMFTTANNIKRLRIEIDSRGYKGIIQLAVGGAVFNLRPELTKKVGGDGTATNAINVPELFNNLYNEAIKHGNF
ncbi:MAG: corrinoid-binding protein [bacterium]|nr:corrinoid-binding protein [bacterium]